MIGQAGAAIGARHFDRVTALRHRHESGGPDGTSTTGSCREL